MMTDDYLVHYGVLGMKWGVRKQKVSSSGRLSKKKSLFSKKNKEEQKKPSENKRKSVNKMSDDELRRKIQRLQMEKQYKDLKYDNLSTGKKVVNKIIKQSATNIGVNVLTTQGTALGNRIVGQMVNRGKKKAS